MYQLFAPHERLKRHIDNYWIVAAQGTPLHIVVDIFVDARADLILNYGAPYTRQRQGEVPVLYHHSNFDAQRLYPMTIRQEGLVAICGVRFLPGGAAPFLVPDAMVVSGMTPPPEDVFGSGIREVDTRIGGVLDNPGMVVDILNDFFLKNLKDRPGLATFYRALDWLDSSDSTQETKKNVGACCDCVAVSPRSLHRYFLRYLGFSAGQYCNIMRFRKALTMLMKQSEQNLADIALECGYFDQSHLVKAFRKYTGAPPRQYRGYYPESIPEDFAPNIVRFLQDSAR